MTTITLRNSPKDAFSRERILSIRASDNCDQTVWVHVSDAIARVAEKLGVDFKPVRDGLTLTITGGTMWNRDELHRELVSVAAEINRRAAAVAPVAKPAPAQVQESGWKVRVPVLSYDSAPSSITMKNGVQATLIGYGKAFRADDGWHERSGCQRPEMIGEYIRYAYYR